jgi:hypothetical protein
MEAHGRLVRRRSDEVAAGRAAGQAIGRARGEPVMRWLVSGPARR